MNRNPGIPDPGNFGTVGAAHLGPQQFPMTDKVESCWELVAVAPSPRMPMCGEIVYWDYTYIYIYTCIYNIHVTHTHCMHTYRYSS